MNRIADVIVIGCGPAGMLASSVAAERGLKVVAFEHNAYTGKKLGITGKGRCNVTNNASNKEVIANLPTNGKFMYSALERFSPADVMASFEAMGVPLKTERGNRVFPVSDKAGDVVQALRNRMKIAGVRVEHTNVHRILTGNGAVTGVETDAGDWQASAVILCTGGCSYPLTGSTGDGYRMAMALGHSINLPVPSLVPLVEDGSLCGSMQGLSLRNVALTVYEDGRKIHSEFGEMLFTHFGISGPIVLSSSAHMRKFEKSVYYVEIDLKPALDEAVLDKRVISDFDKYKNLNFSNALADLLPRKLIPCIIDLSGIAPDRKVNAITKEERKALVLLMKHFKINIAGPRPIDEAIVTSGGVKVSEINPRTMESKLVPGLFFAGEIIDVDGYTGGFNLQIAWSTGNLAGLSVCN